jgi:hypothetical protein
MNLASCPKLSGLCCNCQPIVAWERTAESATSRSSEAKPSPSFGSMHLAFVRTGEICGSGWCFDRVGCRGLREGWSWAQKNLFVLLAAN